MKSRLLYSCKALKIKFGIYTDRDYKERQGVLKSARSVAANCDEFWITKCNKKNYKVRQGWQSARRLLKVMVKQWRYCNSFNSFECFQIKEIWSRKTISTRFNYFHQESICVVPRITQNELHAFFVNNVFVKSASVLLKFIMTWACCLSVANVA